MFEPKPFVYGFPSFVTTQLNVIGSLVAGATGGFAGSVAEVVSATGVPSRPVVGPVIVGVGATLVTVTLMFPLTVASISSVTFTEIVAVALSKCRNFKPCSALFKSVSVPLIVIELVPFAPRTNEIPLVDPRVSVP